MTTTKQNNERDMKKSGKTGTGSSSSSSSTKTGSSSSRSDKR